MRLHDDDEPSGVRASLARPDLAARLNDALDTGSLLVVASAGYGKTTAVESALAARRVQYAWVTCDKSHRDPGRLLRAVLESLSRAAPGAVDVLARRLEAAGGPVDASVVAGELARDLARLLVDAVVLVLDDAESLHDAPDALAVVIELLRGQSRGLRLAICSRRPLALRVAKLQCTGELVELGPRELAFSPGESERLLAMRLRRQLSVDEADQLYAATEGWPLGVAMSTPRDDFRPVPAGASTQQLFQFLEEEMMDHLPQDLRGRILDSSVPRDLDKATIEALGLSSGFVDEVANHGLPLRIDSSDPASFSYHPLVREFLQDLAARERSPDTRREMNARVAGALASAGRPVEAIEHWLAAEAWAQAAQTTATVGLGMLHTAPVTLRRWLAALPVDVRSDPGCQLLEGTLNWEAGAAADAVEQLRAAVSGFAEANDLNGEWRARFALVDPLSLIGGLEEAVSLADGFDQEPARGVGLLGPAVAAYAAAALGGLGRVRECRALSRRILLHPDVGPLREVRAIWECDMMLLTGELDDLVSGGEDAVREFERFDALNRLPLFGQQLAIALSHLGRDDDALELWRRVEIHGRAAHMRYVVKTRHFWSALLHARAGRLEKAEEHLDQTPVRRSSGWREYVIELARAEIASLRGDAGGVAAAADRAVAFGKPAPLVDRCLIAIELAPALCHAGLPAAARDLVDEGLRVLDERLEASQGGYFRALLLATRSWLRDVEGDATRAEEDLQAMWAGAGKNAPHVVRRQWRVLEPLLWTALANGALDSRAVLSAIGSAWPGGEALLPFTGHPSPNVRREAVGAAAPSGHPRLPERLEELSHDPDRDVARAATSAAGRLKAEPPALAFRVLGRFELSRGDTRVEDRAWDRRVAQRLVRYLLVHRGLVADDLLLEAFWPDAGIDSARRSLRVAVSCARAVLDVPGAPSSIEVTQRTLGLRLRAGDAVDADRFQGAANIALSSSDGDRRALLEQAAALWTGEPLPEERYAEWTLAWRRGLHDHYAGVLAALVVACADADDFLTATKAARELVALEPLNETAQRRLILCYARAGRRAEALRQYLECRRLLLDQLGLEPGAETTALQRSVLAGAAV